MQIKNYLSLVKFSHTVFALPFALLGFAMGVKQSGMIAWDKFALVIVCMISARSAAMAFNRYLDRNIDALNPRTKVREIPAGVINPQSALIFTIFCCITFIGASFLINPLCFSLSPIALLVILGYSYTKRFTALCHLVLGVGLGLAPIGAYLAVTSEFSLFIIALGAAVLLWVAGFDIIYALQDEQFDQQNRLHSIPSVLGKVNALWVSRAIHMLSFFLFCLVYNLYPFHYLYLIAVLFMGFILIYQHRIVNPNDLSRVNFAFFTLNGIASVVVVGLSILDLFLF